jgi:hypothetical protein
MSAIAHPKKKKKHPKHMTTDEAMQHLFTKKGHKVLRNHLAKIEKDASTPK